MSSKPKIWRFQVVVLRSTAKKCTEIRVARVAQAYFLFLTNNILALWRCRSRTRRLCLNSLVRYSVSLGEASKVPKDPKQLSASRSA